MNSDDTHADAIAVDERWMAEWLEFGYLEMERYLRRQAQVRRLPQAATPEPAVARRLKENRSSTQETTSPKRLAMGRAGIEPATLGLKVPCSTS